jgi:hypothetical protein
MARAIKRKKTSKRRPPRVYYNVKTKKFFIILRGKHFNIPYRGKAKTVQARKKEIQQRLIKRKFYIPTTDNNRGTNIPAAIQAERKAGELKQELEEVKRQLRNREEFSQTQVAQLKHKESQLVHNLQAQVRLLKNEEEKHTPRLPTQVHSTPRSLPKLILPPKKRASARIQEIKSKKEAVKDLEDDMMPALEKDLKQVVQKFKEGKMTAAQLHKVTAALKEKHMRKVQKKAHRYVREYEIDDDEKAAPDTEDNSP